MILQVLITSYWQVVDLPGFLPADWAAVHADEEGAVLALLDVEPAAAHAFEIDLLACVLGAHGELLAVLRRGLVAAKRALDFLRLTVGLAIAHGAVRQRHPF